MATSVNIGEALALDGPVFDGSDFRNFECAAMAWNGAAYPGLLQNANRMAVQASSGMNITIGPGAAVIPSAAGVTDGAYRAYNNQSRTLTVPASDPTNPRIDIVVVGVNDLGTSSSTTFIEIVTGTPAPSPSAPATPSNTVLLANVAVGAGVTSIASGNITDKRVFTVAPGGILPVATTASIASGVNGQYAYDTANDRIFHLAQSGPRQAHVLPWAPQQATGGATYNGSGTPTLCSVTVTVDGSTDLEIHACWRGYNTDGALASVSIATFNIYLDSSSLKACTVENRSTTGGQAGGSAMFHITTSGGGDRPSAGTHTVALKYTDSVSTSLHPGAASGGELYVRAVPL